MGDTIRSIATRAAPYSLVIFYIVLFSLDSLLTSLVTGLMNVDWASLTPGKKFLLGCVIMKGWIGVMLAFFNKSLSRVQRGEPLLDPDDSGTLISQSTPQNQNKTQ